MPKKSELSKYLAKIGSKGGKIAAANMSKKERSERARKAAQTRFAKKESDGGAL